MTRSTLIDARAQELLTVKEYADMVRCCAKTVYRRIWDNQQPGAVRVGGQWRIDATVAIQPRQYTPLSPVSNFVQ